MSSKKHILKTFVPITAVAAVFGLAASASAQTSPVFEAAFPASWNGTGTTVLDLSGAGNTGFLSGTNGSHSFTTTAVPTGAAAGTGSLAVNGFSGIKITPTGLLNNAAIASAGGFTYNIDFLWNGTDSTSFSHNQKLIDYAGTESLQLVTTAGGTAALQMTFTDDLGATTPAVSTVIQANTWYDVEMRFLTGGAPVDGNGDISGITEIFVNGNFAGSGLATKGTYGDGLNRPIAIGEWGYGHTTSLIGLHGDIYNASIQLGAVPEPSTFALAALGGLGMMFFRRKKA